MIPIFKIDGKTYSIGVITLKRKGAILDGESSGRVKTGEMMRSIIGTYYNYDLVFDKSTISTTEYDELYQTLTAPVDFHTVTFPYGQGLLTFQAYISNVTDSLVATSIDRRGTAIYKWTGLSVAFVAKKPERS